MQYAYFENQLFMKFHFVSASDRNHISQLHEIDRRGHQE